MAIGKKLMALGSYAFAASAFLVICVSVAAVISVVTSGQPVCLPGLSIRCHENDCGRFFQRCGSNALLEVPANKVCHRGVLLSASRIDVHSCPSTTIASNSSRSQAPEPRDPPEPETCSCCGCSSGSTSGSSVNICDCLCSLNSNAGSPVIDPITLKTYPSNLVNECCSTGCCSTGTCAGSPIWENAFATVRRLFTEVSIGQWSLQDVAAHFTFRPPLSTSNGGGCCTDIPSRCVHICG